MKKQTLGIIILFICVMAAALYGYSYFSEKYSQREEQNITQKLNPLNKATDFNVVDENGKNVKLSDFFGKPVIINFWATWCGPCRTELPAFDAAYKKHGDSIHFMMVNLTDGSRDTVDGAKGYVSENGYSFPVFFDTEYSGANAYNVVSIPKTVVINSDGIVVDSYIGVISESKLNTVIDNLLEK